MDMSRPNKITLEEKPCTHLSSEAVTLISYDKISLFQDLIQSFTGSWFGSILIKCINPVSVGFFCVTLSFDCLNASLAAWVQSFPEDDHHLRIFQYRCLV